MYNTIKADYDKISEQIESKKAQRELFKGFIRALEKQGQKEKAMKCYRLCEGGFFRAQATRAMGSFSRMASSTASEIWSQILSGCPSVTDSEVKRCLAIMYFLS